MWPFSIADAITQRELLRAQQLAAHLSQPIELVAYPEFPHDASDSVTGPAKRRTQLPPRRDGGGTGADSVFALFLANVERALKAEFDDEQMRLAEEDEERRQRFAESGDSSKPQPQPEGSDSCSESSVESAPETPRATPMGFARKRPREAGCAETRTTMEDFLASLTEEELGVVVGRRLGPGVRAKLNDYLHAPRRALDELSARLSAHFASLVRAWLQMPAPSSSSREEEVEWLDIHVSFFPPGWGDDVIATHIETVGERRDQQLEVSVSTPVSDLFCCEVVVRDRRKLRLRQERDAFLRDMQLSTAAAGQNRQNTEEFWNSVSVAESESESDGEFTRPHRRGKASGWGVDGVAPVGEPARARWAVPQLIHISDSSTSHAKGGGGDGASRVPPLILGERESSADGGTLTESRVLLIHGEEGSPMEVDGYVPPPSFVSTPSKGGVGSSDAARLQGAQHGAVASPGGTPSVRQSIFSLLGVFYISVAGLSYPAYLSPDVLNGYPRLTEDSVPDDGSTTTPQLPPSQSDLAALMHPASTQGVAEGGRRPRRDELLQVAHLGSVGPRSLLSSHSALVSALSPTQTGK